MSDFYKILGVSVDSEKIVIDAAYRALAKKYHPDVWVGSKSDAENKMRDINQAYEVLSDVQRRREYDSSSKQPQSDIPSSKSENEESKGTIKFQSSMLPKDVSLDAGFLTYKKQQIKISDIGSIEHTVTSTQHRATFVKTHESLDAILILY